MSSDLVRAEGWDPHHPSSLHPHTKKRAVCRAGDHFSCSPSARNDRQLLLFPPISTGHEKFLFKYPQDVPILQLPTSTPLKSPVFGNKMKRPSPSQLQPLALDIFWDKKIHTASGHEFFLCPVCGKSYVRQGDYRTHLSNRHPDLRYPYRQESFKESIPCHGQEQGPPPESNGVEPCSLESDCVPLPPELNLLGKDSSSSSMPSLTYSDPTSSSVWSGHGSRRRRRRLDRIEEVSGSRESSIDLDCPDSSRELFSVSNLLDLPDMSRWPGADDLEEEPRGNKADPAAPKVVEKVLFPHADPKLSRENPESCELIPDPKLPFLPQGIQDSPPWTPFREAKATPLQRANESPDVASCARTLEILNVLTKPTDPAVPIHTQAKHDATRGDDYVSRADMTDPSIEDIDEDDEVYGASMEEKVAAYVGPEEARYWLSVFEKLASRNSFNLLRTEPVFQRCAGGTESSGGSSSGWSKADLATTAKTSLSLDSSKRKRPAGDDEGDQENDQSGDGHDNGGGNSTQGKGSSEDRWYCVLAITPDGRVVNAQGCATTGLLMKDLWRHIKRDHSGCLDCGLKFDKEQPSLKHYVDRDRKEICTPGLHQPANTYIDPIVLEKMGEVYEKRNRNKLQETWAAWWLLVHAERYPRHPAPYGVYQGTISYPSAVFPAMRTRITEQLEQSAYQGKLPLLTVEQAREVCEIVQRTSQALSLTHRVRQKRARKPARTAQAQLSPTTAGPARADTIPPGFNGTAATVPNVVDDPFFGIMGDFDPEVFPEIMGGDSYPFPN